MTALAAERMGALKTIKSLEFTLKSGTKAWKNGLAVLVIGEGVVAPGTAATGRVAIGRFARTVDATSGALPVTVDLFDEVVGAWWEPHTSGAPASTDLGRVCYIQDDQTVTMTATARSLAGRVWAVDSSNGVLVEPITVDQEYLATLLAPVEGDTLSFTAGDCAVTAAQLVNEAVFACPATAAASTITLATTDVPVGTEATFTFDGTANDFDVTLRYGTTAIAMVPAGTTGHVKCIKNSATTWVANVEALPILGGVFPDQVSNDVIVTAGELRWFGVYSLPTLAADSTVTLPITGVPDGMTIFVAAPSPGAYTVTYRYGTTAISAATTASKAHHATLTKLGSAWYANVQVAP